MRKAAGFYDWPSLRWRAPWSSMALSVIRGQVQVCMLHAHGVKVTMVDVRSGLLIHLRIVIGLCPWHHERSVLTQPPRWSMYRELSSPQPSEGHCGKHLKGWDCLVEHVFISQMVWSEIWRAWKRNPAEKVGWFEQFGLCGVQFYK